MAFSEDFSEFFNLNDFAVEATYTPTGGNSKKINVIFDNEYVDLGGATVPVEGTSPVARCSAADVAGVAHGDALIINSTNYLVRGVQPDGTGEMLLILEDQD